MRVSRREDLASVCDHTNVYSHMYIHVFNIHIYSKKGICRIYKYILFIYENTYPNQPSIYVYIYIYVGRTLPKN